MRDDLSVVRIIVFACVKCSLAMKGHPMRAMGKGLFAAAVATVASVALAACGTGASNAESTTDSDKATETTEGKPAEGAYTIAIAQIVTHASLDASVEGFKTALADAGIDVIYEEFNANNDQQLIPSIAASIASINPDLVLAVSTPVAQGLAQTVTDIPILFTAVTDPESAGLVETFDNPGGNISGTTDRNPVKEQLELIKEIVPEAKTVGVVYNPGEENSVVQVDWVKEEAPGLGLEVVEAAVPESRDIQQGVEALNADVIYLPTDNTVISSMGSVLQVAEARGIPVFAAEGDSVENGAIATYGISYYELGYQTGEMAVRILTEGADVSTMSVESQDNLLLYLNTKAAERMSVVLPDSVLERVQPETTYDK